MENSETQQLPKVRSGQDIVFRRSPLTAFGDWVIELVQHLGMHALGVVHSTSIVKNLSAVLEDIEPGTVVSLDFFDTLATRPVEPPEYVFDKIAELSIAHIEWRRHVCVSKDQYLLGRRLCEQRLRGENRDIHGRDHEASLRHVLERFLRQKGIPDEGLTDELLRLEAELEAEVLTIDRVAVDFLSELKSRGHRVLVVSDMYLTRDQFRLILERHGVSDFVDEIYVSGDVGLAKYTGRLFTHVLAREGLHAGEMLHVGDRHTSDFKSPRKLGITAKWLLRKSEAGRRFRTKTALRKDPVRFTAQIVENRARELYGPRHLLQQALFTGIMPALFTMAYRALKDCASNDVRRLFFLAREGITLKAVFDRLLQHHPDFGSYQFETSVLYCSRLASAAGGYKGLHDAQALMSPVLERFGTFSFAQFLDTWRIDLAEQGFATLADRSATSMADLRAIFEEEPRFAERFEETMQERKALFKAYLQQEGVLGQPSALVDVGWGATIQRNIEALAERENIFGIYLGTDERFEARDHQGYLFTKADYRSGAILKAAPITESLLSVAKPGSVKGYEVRSGRVEPVFAPSESISGELQAVRDRVLIDFYPTFEELTRRYCTPDEVLLSYARDSWFKFHCHPQRNLLRKLQKLRFNYDWGERDSVPLFTKISIRAWLDPRKLAWTVWKSPWMFATLKLNYLGLLNTPASWLLTTEGRVNKNSLKNLWARVFGG